MSRLYERLCNLLGESPKGERFEQFTVEVRERPRAELVGSDTFYHFPKAGVLLTSIGGKFESARIYLQDFRPGGLKGRCYTGNLPKNIEPDDTPDAVEAKIGTPLLKSELIAIGRGKPKDRRDTYELGEFLLHFWFDGTNGILKVISTAKRSMLSNGHGGH